MASLPVPDLNIDATPAAPAADPAAPAPAADPAAAAAAAPDATPNAPDLLSNRPNDPDANQQIITSRRIAEGPKEKGEFKD